MVTVTNCYTVFDVSRFECQVQHGKLLPYALSLQAPKIIINNHAIIIIISKYAQWYAGDAECRVPTPYPSQSVLHIICYNPTSKTAALVIGAIHTTELSRN